MTDKPIESIIIPSEQAECWDEASESFVLNAPSNFYVLISTGDRVYYMTRDRAAAQKQADLDWGKGKYNIRTVKDMKTKSKLESGLLSCYGTQSRRGQKKPN